MPDYIRGPEHDGAQPSLIFPNAEAPEAVVLVLHGGQEASTGPVTKTNLALARMMPFARDIEKRSKGRLGAFVLRDAVRGWNSPRKSPVLDARWALEQIAETCPGVPLGVVGHSMGGRVACEIVGDQRISAMVGLAPWIADPYEPERFAGTEVLFMHGEQDKMTSPKQTEALAKRLEAAGQHPQYIAMPGMHAMLWRAGRWHKTTSEFLMGALLPV